MTRRPRRSRARSSATPCVRFPPARWWWCSTAATRGGIGQPKGAADPGLEPGLPERFYEALQAGRGRAILASSRSTELSWVLPGAHNSLFTQHLLAGLGGGIASEDGLIRIFDLFEYLQPRVTADQPRQHPIFKAELEENFPVALHPDGPGARAETDQWGFRYDAYVSYVDRDPDATWGGTRSCPTWSAPAFGVAVSGDVEEPGVARVVGIERGINQSRRTVVVPRPPTWTTAWPTSRMCSP